MNSKSEFWDSLYKAYWDTGNVEEIIKSYKANEADKVQQLVSLFNIVYDQRFVFSVLLLRPDISCSLNKQKWLNIIEEIKRPIKVRLLFENLGQYADLIFLYRYIEIDSLALLMESNLSNPIKEAILKDLKSISREFICTDFDLEYFEDGTYNSKDLFLKCRDNLVLEGAKQIRFQDIDEYLDELLSHFSD